MQRGTAIATPEPFYEREGIRLYVGDNREVLPALEPESISAVCTDPPYGLSKEPDMAEVLTHWLAGDDYKHKSGGFMSASWDSFVPGPATWRMVAATMKPGAHLCSFAGTRTYDLMGIAIRLAGMQYRETCMFLYGSGFPKSLDVGKAIDKANGNPLAFRDFSRAYAVAVDASDYTHSDIDRKLGIKSSSCYWAREDHRGGIPPRHHWERVSALLGLPESFARLYDEAEREVVGTRRQRANSDASLVPMNASVGDVEHITAPATDAARQWDGWGTALKPAYEPVLTGYKPLQVEHFLAILTEDVRSLLCLLSPANDAETLWNATRARSSEVADSVLDSARIYELENSGNVLFAASRFTCTSLDSSEAMGSSALTPVKASGSQSTTSERTTPLGRVEDFTTTLVAMCISGEMESTWPNIVSSWNSISDDLLQQASTFTTSTGTRLTIALTTLRSSLSQIISGDTGSSSRKRLTPDYEPVILARKPLSGTVAATVLAHGTGAINVDGCRVKAEGADDYGRSTTKADGRLSLSRSEGYGLAARPYTPSAAGRWPPNVLLDDAAAEVLDQQSGERKSGAWNGVVNKERTGQVAKGAERQRVRQDRPADTGGASRFFPRLPVDDPEWYACDDCHITRHISDLTSGCPQCGETMVPSASPLPVDDPGTTRFMYTAKASRKERNAGMEGMPERNARRHGDTGPSSNAKPNGQTALRETNHHPTVKPLSLMRWLLTLVIPPGGVVLDPFAGSGSTLVAAAQLGIQAVGIEMDAEYAAIAAARIDHALDERARGAVFGNGTDARHAEKLDLTKRQVNFDGMGYHGASGTEGKPTYNEKGRWPCNVILDQDAARELDQQSGERKSPGTYKRADTVADTVYGKGAGVRLTTDTQYGYGDTGGASRFMVVLEGDDEPVPVPRQRSLFDKAGD